MPKENKNLKKDRLQQTTGTFVRDGRAKLNPITMYMNRQREIDARFQELLLLAAFDCFKYAKGEPTNEERKQRKAESWDSQMPELLEAYLDYRIRLQNESEPFPEPAPNENDKLETLKILTWDQSFHGDKRIPLTDRNDPEKQYKSNAALIRFGYIGNAPRKPSVAFSIRTLAAFEAKLSTSPRLNAHAEARRLCEIHGIEFKKHVARNFSSAYEVYIKVMNEFEELARSSKMASSSSGSSSSKA